MLFHLSELSNQQRIPIQRISFVYAEYLRGNIIKGDTVYSNNINFIFRERSPVYFSKKKKCSVSPGKQLHHLNPNQHNEFT